MPASPGSSQRGRKSASRLSAAQAVLLFQSRRHQERQAILHDLDRRRKLARQLAIYLDTDSRSIGRLKDGAPGAQHVNAWNPGQVADYHSAKVLEITDCVLAFKSYDLEVVIEQRHVLGNLEIPAVVAHARGKCKSSPARPVVGGGFEHPQLAADL